MFVCVFRQQSPPPAPLPQSQPGAVAPAPQSVAQSLPPTLTQQEEQEKGQERPGVALTTFLRLMLLQSRARPVWWSRHCWADWTGAAGRRLVWPARGTIWTAMSDCSVAERWLLRRRWRPSWPVAAAGPIATSSSHVVSCRIDAHYTGAHSLPAFGDG